MSWMSAVIGRYIFSTWRSVLEQKKIRGRKISLPKQKTISFSPEENKLQIIGMRLHFAQPYLSRHIFKVIT